MRALGALILTIAGFFAALRGARALGARTEGAKKRAEIERLKQELRAHERYTKSSDKLSKPGAVIERLRERGL